MEEQKDVRKVEIAVGFYDRVETYTDCTVQVLTNTATGEVSVGWWRNEDGTE